MAIVFDCPHCKHPYRLKDEFAGRKATCKNPDCRQQITIPVPLSGAELEAAALSALAEEEAKPKEAETAVAEEQGIPMSCPHCDHKWSEPFAKAGKNTLCANPECRQRIKVPELTRDQPQDWRQQKSRLPSLAKQAHEKLDGVQDAGEARIVSGQALREADATGIEYEPRDMKRIALFATLALALVGGIAFGFYYLFSSRSDTRDDQLMVDALKEYGDTAKEIAPSEAGLYGAILHGAAAEYALRQNTEAKLTEAQKEYTEALNQLLKSPPSAERNAVAAELALLAIAFGGTDDEVKARTRYRWQPDFSGGSLGMGQKQNTVHQELTKALGKLSPVGQSVDFDFRVGVARRLTRALADRGQPAFAADIIPLALFTQPEQDEARAVIALELHRKKATDVAARIARDLKSKLDAERSGKTLNFKGNPFPISTQTLCVAVGIEFRPLVSPPPASGSVSDAARLAFTGTHLLDGSPDAALQLARRGVSTDAPSQLRSLVLYAEWAADPGPAIEAAVAITQAKTKQTLPQSHLQRLAQIAAGAGRHAEAAALAEALTDEGLKAWTRGDAVRQRILANPNDRADEGWVELPATADKLRAGHAWGRFWIARQNAKLSGDRAAERKATSGWTPAAIHPFALAGIAVGLQDR